MKPPTKGDDHHITVEITIPPHPTNKNPENLPSLLENSRSTPCSDRGYVSWVEGATFECVVIELFHATPIFG